MLALATAASVVGSKREVMASCAVMKVEDMKYFVDSVTVSADISVGDDVCSGAVVVQNRLALAVGSLRVLADVVVTSAGELVVGMTADR